MFPNELKVTNLLLHIIILNFYSNSNALRLLRRSDQTSIVLNAVF